MDNLGSSSPGVGHYNNDTKQLYKAVKRNTNFTCSFGKAQRLNLEDDRERSLGSSGSLKSFDNMDLINSPINSSLKRNASKESFQIAP